MIVYFSWAHSDPFYPAVAPDSGVLVSVANVSGTWRVSRFPALPRSLMLDSGGYQVLRGEERGLQETLSRQLRIAADMPGTVICTLDMPFSRGYLSARERYARLERTLANAYAYKTLARELAPATTFELLAVIQGDDRAMIQYCAGELVAQSFDRYGVGSLAPLYSTREVTSRVEAAFDIVGPNLHVFGISAVATLRELSQLGIRSIDTARPMHGAIYNELLYSRPFRRYGVRGSHYQEGKPKFPADRELSRPLPCDCPKCTDDPLALLELGTQRGIHHRALHNAYHWYREIMASEA